MSDDHLTITVAGQQGVVVLDDFLSILQDTRDILSDIDGAMYPQGGGVVRWELSRMAFGSPPTLGVCAQVNGSAEVVRRELEAFAEGLVALETDGSYIPPYFARPTLVKARSLVGPLRNSIGSIEFATMEGRVAAPSLRLAEHVDALLPQKRIGFGSVYGRLETLTQHQGTSFRVWDASGRSVLCSIPPELLPEAKVHFGERVVVHGEVQYGDEGLPERIKVQQVRWVKEPRDLPRFRDLEGIDITGGVDSVEYVRGVRDGGA